MKPLTVDELLSWMKTQRNAKLAIKTVEFWYHKKTEENKLAKSLG